MSFNIQSRAEEALMLLEQPENGRNQPIYTSSLHALWNENLYFNIAALISFPLGVASSQLDWGAVPTFLLNMVTVVCLAKTLDLATDQLSNLLGQTIGALLNVTFGNFVELVVGLFALLKGLIVIVQSSLLGSILSNLLFVLGMCFVAGGYKFKEQEFSRAAADINAALLLLAGFSLILPAAFANQIASLPNSMEKNLQFSRYTSIVLLIAYGSFLWFQLVTHPHFFETPKPEGEAEEEEEEEIILNVQVGLGSLIGASVLIAISADNLVSAIEGISTQWNLSETFIGLIILPLVGNAPEHLSAVYAAMRNKMDLCIGIALGSSLQIAIFCTPFLTIIGWIVDKPMSLAFPTYDAAVVFISILVVIQLVNDGRSNWLEGCLLMLCYVIIAIGYAIIPNLESPVG